MHRYLGKRPFRSGRLVVQWIEHTTGITEVFGSILTWNLKVFSVLLNPNPLLRSYHHDIVSVMMIAELQRAKRASEAPLVRKISNPSSRENLVMTSPCERPLSVQTLGEGEGISISPSISGVLS